MRAIALCLVLAVAVCSVMCQFNQECPENQEWSNCASICEPQCNKFNGVKCPPFLTLQCVFQCVCKRGFLRIEENECAPIDSEDCGGLFVPVIPPVESYQ